MDPILGMLSTKEPISGERLCEQLGMTRAAATDLGTYGIRVNAVNPGLVLSGMTLPRGQNSVVPSGPSGMVWCCQMYRGLPNKRLPSLGTRR